MWSAAATVARGGCSLGEGTYRGRGPRDRGTDPGEAAREIIDGVTLGAGSSPAPFLFSRARLDR